MDSESKPSGTPPPSGPDGRIPRKYWIITGVVVVLLAVLAFAPTLLAPSDASLRNKILGKWEAYDKDGGSLRFDFRPDGSMVAESGNLAAFEFTWGFDRGVLVLRVKHGSDWFSDLSLLVSRIFRGGDVYAPQRSRIRFLSESQFFEPGLGVTFTRLGVPPAP